MKKHVYFIVGLWLLRIVDYTGGPLTVYYGGEFSTQKSCNIVKETLLQQQRNFYTYKWIDCVEQ